MDHSADTSQQNRAHNFQIESLDDPNDEEALDKAFGTHEDLVSTTVMARREDHPPTTQKEVWGWYLYEAACQPYSKYVDWMSNVQNMSIERRMTEIKSGGYMPILVNDMAKFYAATTANKCQVSVLGFKMLPAAFASSVISLSVLLQAILFLATSAIADFGSLRKVMLMATAFAGAVFTAAFIFATSSKMFLFASILLLLSNIFFGYSVVFYNAYLAPIVRSMPEYTEVSQEEQHDVMDRLANKLSTRSYMLGYACGIIMLLVSLPIVLFAPKVKDREWWLCERGKTPLIQHDDDTSLGFRVSIFITGLWWFGISLFPLFWIKTRPGPPLPPGKNYVSASISNILKTVTSIKQLRHSFIFLIAYFLFSDAYNTISYVGILFAKNDMGASSIQLIIILLEVPLLALAGNFFFLWVKTRFGFQSKTMLYINLGFFLFLPIYAFVGFIPAAPFGMKRIWELYFFGAVFGFNIGSIQSFARTVFISLTPPGHEAEFFGFYEITDKGSAWIGPAIVALMTEWTGQVRYSFLYLFVALVIPAIILKFVDVREGTMQARAFAEAENSEPMVEFGRLDSGDDDDDGLSHASDEFSVHYSAKAHAQYARERSRNSIEPGEALLKEEEVPLDLDSPLFS